MSKNPLKLSNESVRNWALIHKKSVTPARLCEAYGITFDLLLNVLDSWMDHDDKGIVNLAAEITLQNSIKAKRNEKEVDPLIMCKAVEKLTDNLFDAKNAGISLRANRILGNAIDEYAQRKINITVNINRQIINQIIEIAEKDGETIIDVECQDSANEGKGEGRPLLSLQSDSGLQQNDGISA